MRNSIVPAKEKDSEIKEYYKKLAVKISLYKYLLVIFIIVFIIYCFSNYKSEITIENFRYMLKFFDFTTTTAAVDSNQIGFDLAKEYSSTIMRGNIAVADSSGISLYDFSGKRMLKSAFLMEHVNVSSSAKYVYAYDLGGNALKIYNTYSEIKSFDYDYPIMGFTNNSNGAFGVITSAPNYRSAVIVYDKEFLEIYNKKFGDKYTVSIALNKYGNRLLTFMSSASGGDFVSEVYELDTTKEDPINTLKFIGEMPLKVSYCDDNSIIVLTSKALRMYDNNFNLKSEMFFSENLPVSYHFSGKYVIMSYIVGTIHNSSRIDIYDLQGNLVRSESFEEDIQDIAIGADKAYVLTYTEMHTIDIVVGKDGDSVFEVTNGANKLQLNDDNLLLVSNHSSVVTIINKI